MTQAQWLPTASRIQISREILGELRDLDPTIDLNWRKRVGAIMQRLGSYGDFWCTAGLEGVGVSC